MLLFGLYALTDGVLALIAALTGRTWAPRWWLAIVGIAGIAAGITTFMWPGITAVALLAVVAVWALASGLMQVIGAIQLRKQIDNEWLLIIGGIVSMLFGLLLLLQPVLGGLALVFSLGVYAVVLWHAAACVLGAAEVARSLNSGTQRQLCCWTKVQLKQPGREDHKGDMLWGLLVTKRASWLVPEWELPRSPVFVPATLYADRLDHLDKPAETPRSYLAPISAKLATSH